MCGDYMKKIQEFVYDKNNSLFNSILFLLLGIILFTNPGGIVKFISYIIGGILIAIGIFNILSYYKTLKKLNIEYTSKLISGIIIIVIGFIVILFSSFIETTIRLVCGGFIIYRGVIKLIESLTSKTEKTYFYITLVISILMILCGFYVALTVNLVFEMIGLFIIIYAILDIVNYVTYKKKN